jgi:hypothetical protein
MAKIISDKIDRKVQRVELVAYSFGDICQLDGDAVNDDDQDLNEILGNCGGITFGDMNRSLVTAERILEVIEDNDCLEVFPLAVAKLNEIQQEYYDNNCLVYVDLEN